MSASILDDEIAPDVDVCTITLDGLGGLYQNSIENFREVLADRKRTGYVLVAIEPKINGEELFVVVNAATLYLIGVKGAGGTWYQFPDETDAKFPYPAKPALGSTHYSKLGLESCTKQSQSANVVVAALRMFNGSTADAGVCRNLLTVILLVSEAARFASVEVAMCEYIKTGSIDLKKHYDTVTSWKKQTAAKSADVLVPYLDPKADVNLNVAPAKKGWQPKGKK